MHFQVFRGCYFWASRNHAVQIFFLTTTRNIYARKICKVSKIFGYVAGVYFLPYWRVEVHKISEVFSAKLYCKMNRNVTAKLYNWFLLALKLLLENLKLKDKLQTSVQPSLVTLILFWCGGERGRWGLGKNAPYHLGFGG